MNFQRRLALGMVSLTALYTGSGLALGLGDLQLQSALNQPLQALIQLHDSEGLSPADVRVSLADADTFSRVGIDRPFFLTDLSFTPVLINQQLMIRVESSRPVKEPYLNFLVQLTRSSGSLLREYTLLLDPPLYAPTPVVNSSSTPAAATVAAAPQRTAPAPVSAPRPVARTTGVPALQPQPGAERYQTVTGDSLWTIAAATRPDESIPVQRQMDAILGLNPHAFVNGDPSRLRAGQQLVLPVAEQVGATPSAPARVPSAAEAAPVIAEVPSPAQASDRLRIEEPQVLGAEAEELQNRLNIIESRFLGLLGELEQRDAQIASLQADLESLREARAVEQQSGEAVTAGLDQSVQENHAAQQAALPEQALASTPGAMGSSTGWDQPEEAQAS
ncbi:MAG: FimV/HubP family polar landmark protein, partial [Pseudomonas sp.]